MATLKKALAEVEDNAAKERAACEKHKARVGEVQQELQDAVKKCESLEHDLKEQESELCRGKRAPMGQGPFSVRQGAEGARRADRGEAREGFYPASELSGEIKLLLLLCGLYCVLARER